VVPFDVETRDGERTCVPVVHGWAKERERPSDIEMREYATNRTEMREYDTGGAYRVEAYLDWASGPGACVPGSKDRLRPASKAFGLMTTLGIVLLVLTRDRDGGGDRPARS